MTIAASDAVSPNVDLMRMHPVSLRFFERSLETRFQRETVLAGLPAIRLFLLGATILSALCGFLDPLAAPDAYKLFWMLRFSLLVAALAIVLALTYTPLFVGRAQIIMIGGMLCVGGGILAMITSTHGPAKDTYYAGLILVVIYGSSMVRLHHLNTLAVSLLLFALYQWIAIWVNPTAWRTLFSNDFFLMVSILVGALSGFFQELYVRRNFINQHMLMQGKARAEQLQAEAEAANRSKTEFLGIVSHELRTPLNAIIGFSDMIRQEMFGPIGGERYLLYAKDIHQSGIHLLEIINTILDLSKAEAGRLGLDSSEIDLVATAESCLGLFRDEAQKAELKIRMLRPERPVHLQADARLCRQIIINLLSNAVKFTPSGGLITIGFPSDDLGRRGIEIRDTGIGIAETDLERVILPFVQVEGPLSRNHGGTGLGLPLVKKIAELHEGAFVLDSQIGVGTVATVWFPSSRVLPEAEAETPACPNQKIKLAV